MKFWLKILLVTVTCLLLVLIIGPFLVRVPQLPPGKDPLELADVDSRFVSINGTNVHYKELGRGEPVFILLHGFGASLFSWREVMQPLASYGRVIAYDRPAFGLTDRPFAGDWTGTNPYGVTAQVGLLMGLMDQLGVEKAILVGNSMGGTVAMNFCLHNPQRVQAIVLVDPAVFASGGVSAWLKPLLKTPQMNHLGPLVARSILESGPQMLELAWHDPAKITPEIQAGYRKPLQITGWDQALWELTKADSGIDLSSHLSEFKLPILLITGDDDRIVPTADSIRLAGALPDSQLVVIAQAGHVPQEEQPDAFLQAILQYLKDIDLIAK
jgi:pimeloyl-ACP methyl ester carboxylesterase